MSIAFSDVTLLTSAIFVGLSTVIGVLKKNVQKCSFCGCYFDYTQIEDNSGAISNRSNAGFMTIRRSQEIDEVDSNVNKIYNIKQEVNKARNSVAVETKKETAASVSFYNTNDNPKRLERAKSI